MLHKAWNSKGEMPYCFPRSSIKFQGHTGQNITDFDPNWAFPDYRPVAAFKSLRFALFLPLFLFPPLYNNLQHRPKNPEHCLCRQHCQFWSWGHWTAWWAFSVLPRPTCRLRLLNFQWLEFCPNLRYQHPNFRWIDVWTESSGFLAWPWQVGVVPCRHGDGDVFT